MKRWIVISLLAVIAAILHLQILFSSWGERFEPLVLDLWFNLRGTIQAPSDVVVVAMDESSYRVLNVPMDQAWPRSLHAELLKRLHEYGAKRVVMDILFLGESSNQAADRSLAEALKLTPTVLGADSGIREVASTAGSFTMEELLQPPEIFSSNASQIALARLPDDFGLVRRFVISRTNVTRDVPALYEAAVGLHTPGRGSDYPTSRDYLWYYGPAGTVPTYPIHQVLNPKGALPPETFKDKIVFVGLSLRTELGPSQKDSFRTPFYQSGSVFGVEIQATAASNIIEKKWIHRPSAWTEGIVFFAVTFLMTALIFSLRPQWAGLLLVGFTAIWIAVSYLSFLNGLFIPGAILNGFVLPATYLGSTLVYYLVTHRSQQQVEKAFQMYLSPEMAKQMRANPNGLRLGGESFYATALFSDIEGFTSITETMSAAEASTMLNAYFTEVMNVILDNKGTLIKFIGDAVFALWNAPIKDPNHPLLACETALKIQDEVRKFNASKRFPPLNTRIGINTGPMLVGNLGSDKRFDYTAIGDAVNLASRLEGVNKYFGTYILISEATKKEISGRIKTLLLGSILVPGKNESVDVYTILHEPIDADAEEKWLKAVGRFRGASWDEAAKLFSEVQEIRLKKAVNLYLNQIELRRSRPLDDNWRGQIQFEQK